MLLSSTFIGINININIKIQCYWAHHRLLATVNFDSIEVPAINNKGRFSAVKFWKISKITYTKLTKRHDFPGIVLYKAIKHMYICHIWRLRNVLNLKNGEKMRDICIDFIMRTWPRKFSKMRDFHFVRYSGFFPAMNVTIYGQITIHDSGREL